MVKLGFKDPVILEVRTVVSDQIRQETKGTGGSRL